MSASPPPEGLVPLSFEGDDGRSFDLNVVALGSFDIPLGRGRWRVSSRHPAVFVDERFDLDSEDSTVLAVELELKAQPAALVRATLRPTGGDEGRGDGPEAVLHVTALGQGERHEWGVTCATEPRLRLACKVPRGLWDLRLQVDDFAPIYRWSIEVAEDVDLGQVALRPGASLAGWVFAPGAGVDLSHTEIDVEAVTPSENLAIRQRRIRRSVRATEAGFFQLTGLPPGLFSLEARHPDFAPTRLASIELRASEESRLDPLELQAPAELQLVLDPPTDPFRKEWRVSISESTDRESEKVTGTADREGLWTGTQLTPGEVRLEVFDSRDHRWISEELEVFSGQNVHRPEVHFERLEGLVLMDEEPLAGARVTLREHLGNMRLGARTDEEGRFFVFLKKGLLWDVEVRFRRPSVRAHVPSVEVPPRDPADRWPKKTFEVPKTRVFGEVYYPDGTEVESPTVIEIASVDGERRRFSELGRRDGFEFEGLAAGRYRISASFDVSSTPKRGESKPVEFVLEDGVEVGPLHLELEPVRVLEGQVLSAGGSPVLGAQVLAELGASLGEWRSLSLPSALSDGDGVFRLELPGSSDDVLLTVLAPGFVYHQEQHLLSGPKTSIVVSLNDVGGSVHVADGDAQDPSLRRQRLFLLHGHPMRNGPLILWSKMHPAPARRGDSWHLPSMPTGAYRACLRTPEAEAFLASLNPLPAAWIADFCGDAAYLTPGGSVELSPPE
ncbi:MAG: carboxypeptidase-like regulatory domain-containing protein [Acidobacteriota bacterium]